MKKSQCENCWNWPKLQKNFKISLWSNTLYGLFLKSDHKIQKFHIQIFPRFSGTGFFQDFFLGGTWGRLNSWPLFYPPIFMLCNNWSQLVADGGRGQKDLNALFMLFIQTYCCIYILRYFLIIETCQNNFLKHSIQKLIFRP